MLVLSVSGDYNVTSIDSVVAEEIYATSESTLY